jgi:mono/diheme cytochrome c family protein
MGYLINRGRVRPSRAERPARNLQSGPDNEHLEGPRLNKALLTAIAAAAVLAIVVPLNFRADADRKVEASEVRAEEYVEFGERWYNQFSCAGCHGPAAGGGAAAYTEPRSDLSASWAAPSLDDVFYRYSPEEIEFWIVYGRAGTPMPANGLAAGGAMTGQEVEQVMDYLRSLQLPQEDALALVDVEVGLALSRVASGDARLAELIAEQEAAIAVIEAAPGLYEQVKDLPDAAQAAFTDAGVCTAASAAIVDEPCESPGSDADRDGLSDASERALADVFGRAATILDDPGLAIALDPGTEYTGTDPAGQPVADLTAVEQAFTILENDVRTLRLTTERSDVFLDQATAGLDYLEDSAAAREWDIDFAALADRAFDGSEEAATRAAGLYNAYCARCHTAGYAAGVAFEQEPGSGAWGPALTNGRSVIQFPDIEDQIEFVIDGSELGEDYGVNGIGRGWMPGFGMVLTREDIELIIKFERSL